MRSTSSSPAPTDPELLRTLADNISAMLAYWDATQRCRFANRAYERWFGRSSQSLIGVHIRELLGPLYELNLPYIERVLAGEPQQFEREIPDPAGGPPRHSLANYSPHVVDGVVRGFFVLVTDVSAIKRAEAAVKKSEAKLAGIVSVSADAIVSADESQRIVMFNDGAEKIFGYTKNEILGTQLERLVPERFRATHRAHIDRFAAGSETSRQMGTRSTQFFGLRKNGEEFPIDAAISKLEIGGEILLTVSLRDITDQTRIEAEDRLLAEIGESLVAAGSDYERLLADVAKVLVRNTADWCSVDIVQQDNVRRLRVVHADPKMAGVCDALERYPVRREPLSPLYEVVDTHAAVLRSAVTPEYLESLAQDDEHLRLMRQLDPGSFIVVPLLARGQIVGTLGLGASRASRRFGPDDVRLAERVASIVALAVDNARLHEALERAVRARDDVVAIIAHDLRSPLNTILLTAQPLRHGAEPERYDRTASERIQRACRNMNRLIQDLLDVARLEVGEKLRLDREVVESAGILAEAVEQQHPALATRKLEISTVGTPPRVRADRTRVLQVFDNLLGNAVKFARGRITVGASSKDGEAVFRIADDGPGIPPEAIPHVFERFWQATRSDRRGAGLGLSIVKGIVDAHGGRVWVESEVGVGTTFYFTLPIASTSVMQ